MTEAVYTATAEYIVEMEQRPVKHRVSVSGVLKRLGVSRSGYNAWKKRCPSAAEKHRGEVKEKILKIYEDSHQNYGAPKITRELWKGGEKNCSKNSCELYEADGDQSPMDKALYANYYRF